MLQKNREISFNDLRDALGLTDGNLGTHAQKLLDAGYIAPRHALLGTRFELRYRLTAAGEAALMAYVRALQDLLPLRES